MSSMAGLGIADKPQYSLAELRRLDREALVARMNRIDNQTALEIATQLWNRTMTVRNNWMTGRNQRANSMEVMAGRRLAELPALLESMRKIDFGQIVIGKSTMSADRLQELPAIVRLLMGNPYPRDSRHVADHLIRYLDLYIDPHRRLPQHLSYLGLEWISRAGLICIVLRAVLDWPLWTLFVFLSPSMLLGSRMTLSKNLQRLRLLALYVSFTDEFVGEEQQREEVPDG